MGKPQFPANTNGKKNQIGTLHQNSSLKSMSKDKDQQSIYRRQITHCKKKKISNNLLQAYQLLHLHLEYITENCNFIILCSPGVFVKSPSTTRQHKNKN